MLNVVWGDSCVSFPSGAQDNEIRENYLYAIENWSIPLYATEINMVYG